MLPCLDARPVYNWLRGDRTLDGGNRGGVVVRGIGDSRRLAGLSRGIRAGTGFLADVGFEGGRRFWLERFRNGPRFAGRFLPDAFFSDSRGQAVGQRRVRRLTGRAASGGRRGKAGSGNGALGMVLSGCGRGRLCFLGRTRGRSGRSRRRRGRLRRRSRRLRGWRSPPRRNCAAGLGRRSSRHGGASRCTVGYRASGLADVLWPRPVRGQRGSAFRRRGIALARCGNILADCGNVLGGL